MTTALIPVLAAMYLGSTFNLEKYQKGNADVFDQKTLDGNLQVITFWFPIIRKTYPYPIFKYWAAI